MMDKNKFLPVIKNVFYSFSANIFSLLVSAVVVFILPKVISKEDYGYWQLYLFYIGYVGIFHFGWCDGLYLRYGGAFYEKLNYRQIGQQFWLISFLELILSCTFVILVLSLNQDVTTSTILCFAAINLLLVIPKTYISYLLQATNRIKEYSMITVAEKGFYCAGIVLVLVLGKASLIYLIIAEMSGKATSLALSVASCKEIALRGFSCNKIRYAFEDAYKNLKVGSKLLIANLTGMLILGIIRLAIEGAWSVETFGEVSLAISLSDLLLVFINAVSMVIFPLLKRMNQDKLGQTYMYLREALLIVMFAALVLYYPVKLLLFQWLPAYRVGISYMAILFPVCVFDSKMALVIIPYMKAMRMEVQLLKANIVSVVLSLFLTIITVYWLHSLELVMLSVLLIFMIRSIICERMVLSSLSINSIKSSAAEVLLTGSFCFASWFMQENGWWVYMLAYAAFLLYKRSFFVDLKNMILESRK